MKKFLVCFLFGIIFLLPANKVLAEQQPDLDKKGSIEITMRDTNGNLVTGGDVEVYKVADVYNDSNGSKYVYTTGFDGVEYSLDKIDKLELVSKLNDYIIDNDIKGEVYSNANGKLFLNDLTTGLYLIKQKNAPKGYIEIVPFLVSMPYKLGDNWIYDVDATPKMSPLEQQTIKPEPTTEAETKGEKPTEPVKPEKQENAEKPETNNEEIGTGDRTSIMLYVMPMCVALAVAGICVTKKKIMN